MSYPTPQLNPSTAAPTAPMPAAHPTLPQDDTPAAQAARAAQLTAARTIYTWTTDVPTLPGVPLATNVPKNDEPTIAWFVILIGVGLDIVRNALTVKLGGVDRGELDSPRAHYEAALAECDAIEVSATKIAAEHGVHTGGNIFTRMIGDVENAVAAAERDAHVALLKGYKERLEDLMKVDEVLGLGSKTPRSLEAYRALFATLPVPGIGYMFQNDSEFARLRVQGPNCMLITAVGGALPTGGCSCSITSHSKCSILAPMAVSPNMRGSRWRCSRCRRVGRRWCRWRSSADRTPPIGRSSPPPPPPTSNGAGKWRSSSCRSPTAIITSCSRIWRARIW